MKIPVLSLLIVFSFGSVIAQNSQDENLSKLAEHYFSEKNFNQALPLYQDLHKRNPAADLFFDRHWMCLYELGRYKEAHSVLYEKYKSTNELGLLDDMARVSILSGDPAQAEKEWKELLEGFNYNQNIVRSVGITMSGLRRYDLAKALFLSQRSGKDPFAFNQELIHIYTQTVDAVGAATEFLLLLRQRPEQDGFVESRIIQYFSDSLLSEKMLGVFDQADSAQFPPSVFRIKGTLAKQSRQFDKAFLSNSKYDGLLKNGGSTCFYLINSLPLQEDKDEIIRLAERFSVQFPESQYRGQVDLKLATAYADNVWFKPENLLKIETVFKRQSNERDSGLLRDVYLNAILKSPGTPAVKKVQIEKILGSSRIGNRQYWEWVIALLDKDFPRAQKIISNQAFRTPDKLDFILTSLANKVSIDSLRQALFSNSRDLKSLDTPRFLFFLIQSVPVPAIDFKDYSGIAKGVLFSKLGLLNEAFNQFSAVYDQSTDREIKAMALNEKVLVLIDMDNENELHGLTLNFSPDPDQLSILDESFFKTAVYFYKKGNLLKARTLFELIVKEAPVSSYTAMARDYLNEIRKRNS